MENDMEVEEGLEPHDVFVDLGVLIVEGRIPGGAGRGYAEGPHCPGSGLVAAASHRHDCDPTNNFLCKRAENFGKHMELLWQNNIPMCIEVLLCPDCPCGVQKAQSPEVVNIPTPADLLLEQWLITVVTKRCPEAPQISVRGLFQAVRSQLHFSQLSAWWSSSKGARPAHVSYRVTVPGEAFASQFQGSATEHGFPVAAVARNTAIKVTVRTPPRTAAVPTLACPTHPKGEQNSETGAAGDSKPSTEEPGCWGKRSERGPSDPLLGASLLDPPQSMDLFGRRYQSPSRGSSPSAEAPEWLVCGRGPVCCGRGLLPCWRDASPECRQGQARRGDRSCASAAAPPSDCSRDVASGFLPGVVDDRMQNPCNRPGKHHCRCAYDDDSETLDWEARPRRPAENGSTPGRSPVSSPLPSCSSRASGVPAAAAAVGEEKAKFNLELSRREFEEVLAVLRNRNSPSKPLTQGAVKEVERDASKLRCDASPSTSSEATRIGGSSYKADLLLDAILRTSSHRNLKVFKSDSPTVLPKCKPSDGERTSGGWVKDRTNVVKQKQKANIFLHTASSRERIPHLLAKGSKCSDHDSVGQQLKEEMCNVPSSVEPRTCAAKIPADDGEVSSSERPVPSALDKAKFRRSLGSAASMVFHSRTGLPLTSSPAPVRRGTSCFDFDSSLNSVSAIRSALFESTTVAVADDSLSVSSDDAESDGSGRSPCSPGAGMVFQMVGYHPWVTYCYNLSQSASLLGSFEESVLNGRLEPVSTVQGFTADLGASGSFCPRHLVLPVTVFFYTLGDNDKVSTPYLGHINLGKKGYCIPRSGTIQVTLFNPLGTVVKMFVVMYDLTDMPANSQTFLRQRTLYMPANPASGKDGQPDNPQKYLRYLIHLRFLSSKSGRIFLHTDIRMIIFRKSDFDTATAHGLDMSYELRSFTHCPANPKFSPRK